MRIFNSAAEAVKEIERDVYEMGTRVTTRSYQDKVSESGFNTLELVGYSFTLTRLEDNWEDVFDILQYPDKLQCLDYIEEEVKNRLGLLYTDSAQCRPEMWDKFRESDGKFSYTYRDRLNVPLPHQQSQMNQLVDLHKQDNCSRQLVLPMWNPVLDNTRRGGIRRVPCTMYFQVLDRGNEFYFIHNMRSCDLYAHFLIDMLVSYRMAVRLSAWMKDKEEVIEWPKLIMTFGSLHAFERDITQKQIF